MVDKKSPGHPMLWFGIIFKTNPYHNQRH